MRPRRIRCQCCNRLMAFEPYKKGDAIRRPVPNAGHCLDCKPGYVFRTIPAEHGLRCHMRGCKPASAVDKLASLARVPFWPSAPARSRVKPDV